MGMAQALRGGRAQEVRCEVHLPFCCDCLPTGHSKKIKQSSVFDDRRRWSALVVAPTNFSQRGKELISRTVEDGADSGTTNIVNNSSEH